MSEGRAGPDVPMEDWEIPPYMCLAQGSHSAEKTRLLVKHETKRLYAGACGMIDVPPRSWEFPSSVLAVPGTVSLAPDILMA